MRRGEKGNSKGKTIKTEREAYGNREKGTTRREGLKGWGMKRERKAGMCVDRYTKRMSKSVKVQCVCLCMCVFVSTVWPGLCAPVLLSEDCAIVRSVNMR